MKTKRVRTVKARGIKKHKLTGPWIDPFSEGLYWLCTRCKRMVKKKPEAVPRGGVKVTNCEGGKARARSRRR